MREYGIIEYLVDGFDGFFNLAIFWKFLKSQFLVDDRKKSNLKFFKETWKLWRTGKFKKLWKRKIRRDSNDDFPIFWQFLKWQIFQNF